MEAKAPLVSFLIKISTFILRVSPSSQTGQFISEREKKCKFGWTHERFWKAPDSSLTSLWGFVGKLSWNPSQSSQTSSQLTMLKANRLWDFTFFSHFPPLQSTNVMDKGQTHYSWLSICLVQMQALKWEASFHGQHPGPCAPVTNVCKTHTGAKSKS